MSQPGSGSGFSIDGIPGQTQMNQDESGQTRQNGRASADILADVAKTDLSNGFEARGQARPQQTEPRSDTQGSQQQQSNAKNQILQQNQQQQQQQQQNQQQQQQQQEQSQQQVHTQQLSQQHTEERPPSVPVLLAHQPYHDNIVIDRVQFVPQGSAQPIPVHAPPYAPEYVIAAPVDSLQYSQIHSAMYNPAQGQYVSRDPSPFRDSSLYTQNVALATAQGTYVQQPPQPQMSSQPAGSQPSTYYANKGLGLPPPVATGYVHFGPQIHYSQYPQTVMNTAPYGSQKNIYPPQYSQQQQPQQPSSTEHSPNPQRFSQELSYQGQPIIQPIAQNIGHTGAPCITERASRGPKPMVPPRGNSKITHESGHRKSASVDVPAVQKPKGSEGSTMENQTTQDLQHQQVHAGQDNQDRRYPMTINQNPRTRQDGLYVEANGDSSREQAVASDTGNADCGIYVSRSEHRKSVSADVTSSFQRRNDTITFTFPSDGNTQQDPVLIASRKPVASANVTDNKSVDVNASNYSAEQRRLDVNASLRMSPMPVLPPISVVPKGILVSGERKSIEWSSLSPNQRIAVPQENRRSDYFEEHRRSPMTVDSKRFEEIRRSPMAFVPIRDTNAPDRINQKSPNNLVNQNFEKTRAELAIWAEQRQRQEIENRMMQNREIFTTSPRSRNQSEERRPDSSRSYTQVDKEPRMSIPQSAFKPIANISQSSIMEQRRHLRHVSADLTKHMELSRKEFDDQHLTGSVLNLGTTSTSTSTANVVSQRASPNICYQYPALSEAKLDTKMSLSVVTDFNEAPAKPIDQVDHIIHSHRKSQNLQANLLAAGKSQESAPIQPEQPSDKTDSQQVQCQQLFQNQQSIDFISEKLSQCERQQSDLQAKLQTLQSQNEILDKVAQFQYQQNDLQTRMHNLQLQSQIAEKLGQRQSSEFSQTSCHDDQDQTNKSILNQCINASRHLYQQSLLTSVTPQMQASYLTSERGSPRLQFQQAQEESDLSDSIQIPNISQMPLPSLSQFDRADILSRASFSQLQRMQSTNDNLGGAPYLQMNLPSVNTSNLTGTLKKVPPEKPPRTSLIAQSPDTESNRSQPAIGLKHTSKARPTIFGTVASDLNPKDGNSRRVSS